MTKEAVRVCPRCKKEKLLTQFYSWVDPKYGVRRYQTYCKGCMKTYAQGRHKARGRKPLKTLAPRAVQPKVGYIDRTAIKQRIEDRAEQRRKSKRDEKTEEIVDIPK